MRQGRQDLASHKVNRHEHRNHSSLSRLGSRSNQPINLKNGKQRVDNSRIMASSSMSSSKRLIQRRRLDARVTGNLQDVLATQPVWDVVEFNASSKLCLRLLEVLSHCAHVQSLILMDPCEEVQQFLGEWLENAPSTLATIDHVSIRNGTIATVTTAEALRDGFSSQFCHVTHLELCDVSLASWNVVQSIAKGLGSLQRLTKLSLRSCHLEDQEVALLLRALQDHVHLTDLCLSRNYCQEQGTMAIAEILTCPTTSLQLLDLSNQETWDDRRYYLHLARALSNRHCLLQDLNLASDFVHDGQFIDLLNALDGDSNTHLKILNLRDNRITDVGMHHLVQCLPNLALTNLDLSHNSYGKPVVLDLEDVLKQQTTLLQLSIDHAEQCPRIFLYLALNVSGRYCKSHPDLPLGLWPWILERCQQNSLDVRFTKGPAPMFHFTATDLLFDLLHGPVLLER